MNLFKIVICCFSFLFLTQSGNSQLRVVNNSNCDLYVYVGEATSPCNLCNTSAVTLIGAGDSFTFTPSPGCAPEYWKGIVFSTSPTPGVAQGYTYNPVPLSGCSSGTNSSVDCGLGTISGNWSGPGGGGPQMVVIQ